MPSTYAHYRFGCRMLPQLPEEAQAAVRKYRNFYDLGVHGPDPLFYYLPIIPNKIGQMGSVFHHLTGAEFFGPCIRRYRLEPSEAAAAHLYGVLTHYVLDSFCHPAINGWAAEGKAGHAEIETELDRFLLETDGKIPPSTQDLSRHMVISRKECRIIAGFYAPVSPEELYLSCSRMRKITRLLSLPHGPCKTLMSAAAGALGGTAGEMVMGDTPNARCTPFIPPLMALYEEASEAFPGMARQFAGMLAGSAVPDSQFSRIFG